MGLALSFTPFAVRDAVMLFRDKLAAAYGAMDWLPIPDGQIPLPRPRRQSWDA